MSPTQPKDSVAAAARWKLERLYSGIDDPQLETDLQSLTRLAEDFSIHYRGQLATKLSAALVDYERIEALQNRVFGYLFLSGSLNLSDQSVKSRRADAENRWQAVAAKTLTFFDIELCGLDDATVERWCGADGAARRFRPWVDERRRHRPHQLPEPVETALASRSTFGPAAWHDFYDEIEADLRFSYDGQVMTQPEILRVINDDPDGDERAAALKSFHEGLGGTFHKLAAQALYITAGFKAVDDTDRNFATPLAARNLGNQVDDAVVEALHQAVRTRGAEYARRYYRLKADLLGLDRLRWSDRNAPLPLAPTTTISWTDALRIVESSIGEFSPTLGKLAQDMMRDGSIDAPAEPGKHAGAFNLAFVGPDGQPQAFTLLNYLGGQRDVMTLAHELGHGLHGLLSGAAQGPLMAGAPLAYCETASVFAEMLVFESLSRQLDASDDDTGRLALVMDKIDDVINTVVRQISFSDFELAVHSARRRLDPNECDRAWLEVTRRYYGEDGDLFTYEHADRLWSYVSHFHRPFYVYAYAFGELLTHSLMACRPKLGADFEPAYLELLRAGGTKDAVALLAPFGLDPRQPQFWLDGLDASLGRLIAAAEKLARDVK